MKRVLVLVLAISLLLLCACTQTAEPQRTSTAAPTSKPLQQTVTPIAGKQNRAYPEDTTAEGQHPNAIGLIKSGDTLTPTVEWKNGNASPIYIIPRYTGSTVAVYRQTQQGFEETPTFQTIAEDGCVISACLDNGESWYIEVTDHEGNTYGDYAFTSTESPFIVYNFLEPRDPASSIEYLDLSNSALDTLDLERPEDSFRSLAVIVREYEGAPTVSWLEEECDGFYILPYHNTSAIYLHEIIGEENGEYIFAEEPTRKLSTYDGCVVYAQIERPEEVPKWGLRIWQYGNKTDYPLLAPSADSAEWIVSAEPVLLPYAKPVIYLYPDAETEVSVKLDFKGDLTCTYPSYENGWTVTAQPDGTLTDAEGKVYNYLYWEGEGDAEYDFTQGFCVAGKDTADFLEQALEQLGLTRREVNEFIVYWLPLMQNNPYNVISFQGDIYTDYAPLEITPTPDSLLRVFMAWYPSEAAVDIAPQTLSTTDRNGFTVVEWGGSQCNPTP